MHLRTNFAHPLLRCSSTFAYRSTQLSMKSVLLFRYMQIYSDLWSTLDKAVCVHTYLFRLMLFFCFFY